jgi:hypothetical protein
MHTQQLQQLMPDRTNVKHGCLGRRINQDVQVAAFLVFAMKHRAENSGIAGAVPQHYAANRSAVGFKGNRWFHGAFSKVNIQLGHINTLMNTHLDLSFEDCKDSRDVAHPELMGNRY